MLPDRAARSASATRAVHALRRCEPGCWRRGSLDGGATELGRRQREGPLHGGCGPRLLHALEQCIEFIGEGVEGNLFRPDERPVFLDRDQHRARLVMLGNGEPTLSGDTIENPSKAVLGDAGRNLRRISELVATGTNTADYSRHGHSAPGRHHPLYPLWTKEPNWPIAKTCSSPRRRPTAVEVAV